MTFPMDVASKLMPKKPGNAQDLEQSRAIFAGNMVHAKVSMLDTFPGGIAMLCPTEHGYLVAVQVPTAEVLTLVRQLIEHVAIHFPQEKKQP